MILIAVGSSLSYSGRSPEAIVESALGALGRFAALTGRSRLYASPAWPDPADPPFVNAVAAIETALSPTALLAALRAVEAGFGRKRSRPNAPRTLDLDLIDYHGLIMDSAGPPALVLPHPRMASRDFVLAPLADIAPGWRHPVLGLSPEALLAAAPKGGARPLGGAASILQRSG